MLRAALMRVHHAMHQAPRNCSTSIFWNAAAINSALFSAVPSWLGSRRRVSEHVSRDLALSKTRTAAGMDGLFRQRAFCPALRGVVASLKCLIILAFGFQKTHFSSCLPDFHPL
jgi:hypothetical protein